MKQVGPRDEVEEVEEEDDEAYEDDFESSVAETESLLNVTPPRSRSQPGAAQVSGGAAAAASLGPHR